MNPLDQEDRNSLGEEQQEKKSETLQQSKDIQQSKKKSVFRHILSFVGYVVLILVLTFIIVNYVGVRTQVVGSSMYPTLENGDNLIVEKVSYYFRDPQRFDIVVFPYPEDPDVHYIKRIIGLPGETVQIIDGYVYIDGELLEEDVYGYEVMNYAGIAQDPIVLGEDEYFVLGDNRNNSEDSRFEEVGVIQGSDITGRAWIRIWPLSSFGFLGAG